MDLQELFDVEAEESLADGEDEDDLEDEMEGFIDDYEAHYQGAPARKTSSRSQSPSSSTSPLPASDISHDRHGWVDHLAVRYASGQGHSLQKPPMPMDDGDCPLDKHLLERVYTDPFIYIVLLYCKTNCKATVLSRLVEVKAARAELNIHDVVPHPLIDAVFLILERDFNPQVGYVLQSIPACVRSSFFPSALRSIGIPPPNPPRWRSFRVYISDVPNHAAFLKVIKAPPVPKLIGKWVQIPSGLYRLDVGLVTRQYVPAEDVAKADILRRRLEKAKGMAAAKRQEIYELRLQQQAELAIARETTLREVEAKKQEVGPPPRRVDDRLAWLTKKTALDEEAKKMKDIYDALEVEAARALEERQEKVRQIEKDSDEMQNQLGNPNPLCSILVVPRPPEFDFDLMPQDADMLEEGVGEAVGTVRPIAREKRKRKRVGMVAKEAVRRPQARLTPPGSIGRPIKDQEGDIRTYQGISHRTFEHDLEIINLRTSVVRRHLTNYIDPSLLDTFLRSQHPTLASMCANPNASLPLPSDWILSFGDRLEDFVTKQSGTYTVSSHSSVTGVEIFGDDGQGFFVPRHHLMKVVQVGDLVKCRLSHKEDVGPGFVVDISEHGGQRHATVMFHTYAEEDDHKSDAEDSIEVNSHTVHVNTLRILGDNWYDRPDKTTDKPVPFLGYTGPTPWLGRKVQIDAEGDAHHKEQAVVKDVILDEVGNIAVTKRYKNNAVKYDDIWERFEYDPSPFITSYYPNGIRIRVQFTRVRDHAVEGTYYYEQVRDWDTLWPLRIACPLRRNQTAFGGPLEVRRLEWGADYPKWNPADIAKRSLMYRCEAEDTPAIREENALKLAEEMRRNDPTLRSQPPPRPPPPRARSPRPEPTAGHHWLEDGRLSNLRVELFYKVIETGSKASASKKQKRKTDAEEDGIRIIATLTPNPSGSRPVNILLRCAAQSLLPQTKCVLDFNLCKPVHPGTRFGNNYRLYAFRGPHEGKFMRPYAHQRDENNNLVHMGVWVKVIAGLEDVSMGDGPAQTIVFRDEHCVLVKDTKDEVIYNLGWEHIRSRGRL